MEFKELNKDLVLIHSHLCGDGNLYVKLEKRSPSSIRTGRTTKPFKRYTMEYTNTSQSLLDEMARVIKNVCPSVYVYKGKQRVQVRNKPLYLFMKKLGCATGGKWRIPSKIIEKSEFRRIWLRAFFDDEGSVYKDCLLCYNTNKQGILTIKKMLKLEGFRTTLTEKIPKNKKYKICYTLRIVSSDFLLFKKIGFNHSIKKEKYKKFSEIRMRRLG